MCPRQFIATAAIVLCLSACGGGGSDSAPAPIVSPPPPPPVSSGPTWTKGVFEDESQFKDRCENPRSGTNPATGNPFPDMAGSILEENHWLRSWSNNTYLWYSEIDDQDPAGFNDPLVYFDELVTPAVTPSGNPKDQFHFTYDTAEYQELISSGSSAGYGAEFAIISGAPPREIRVSIVESGSPAANSPASLLRGTEILEIDGVDAVNGGTQADVDVLNAGLFPNAAGEMHTFTVRDIGSSTTRSFSMTSESVTSAAVHTVKIENTPSGDTGYILFNTFGIRDAEEQIIDAMTQLSNANVNELVLDLRYNGGGFLDIAAQLGYMVAGATRSNGKTFDNLTFNDKHPNINPVTGETLTPTPFHSTSLGFSKPSGQALPQLNLDRIFILSTARTCSASEAVINGLRGVDVDVVLIGDTTCGKPYGFYATDNCGTTYFTIQFKGANDKGFGDYADGFTPMNTTGPVGELVPGCNVADDFLNQLGDSNEALFSTALAYSQSGSCPAGSSSTKFSKLRLQDQLQDERPGSLYNSEHLRRHLLKQQVRDAGQRVSQEMVNE
ncbi:MAG: peptidase [Gammaproteobacteria bacterium]|nr:peptidase [Gammaproteobacteria bacterium]